MRNYQPFYMKVEAGSTPCMALNVQAKTLATSQPPLHLAGKNMRITLIAFAIGRLGVSELRRVTTSPILQNSETPIAKATKRNYNEVIGLDYLS